MIHIRHALFPMILATLTLALSLFVVWMLKGSSPSVTPQESVEFSQTEYEQSIRTIVEMYAQKEIDGTEALNRLLSLRVPISLQQSHLELALVFNKIVEGDVQAAEERLKQLWPDVWPE